MTEQPLKVKKTKADYPNSGYCKPLRTTEEVAACRSPRAEHGRSVSRRKRVEAEKESIIIQAKSGKTDEEITAFLNLSSTSIHNWLDRDANFRAKHDEAIECAVRSARGQLVGSLGESVTCINEAESTGGRTKLQYQAAVDKVRGLGVYQHGPVVAVDQSDRRQTLNIIVADAETKELMEKAKERLLGNGH